MSRQYTITRTPLTTRFVMMRPIREFTAEARDAGGVVARIMASAEHGVTFAAMLASNPTPEQWRIYAVLARWARLAVEKL